jgi:hypothetical protein
MKPQLPCALSDKQSRVIRAAVYPWSGFQSVYRSEAAVLYALRGLAPAYGNFVVALLEV